MPFIARYRKEATRNLDEAQIRSIEEKLAYFCELKHRRATILAHSRAVLTLRRMEISPGIGFPT